jgi:hypothetical protein
MQDINLLEALEKAQLEHNQTLVLSAAESILNNEAETEQNIESRIVGKSKNEQLHSPLHKLDVTKMFDEASIEKLCTDYRLRFLDSKLFKDQVPAEAIREVKRIEASTGYVFEKFSIIAPEERFNLLDSTKDPILMAVLPNEKYYFIFQWGNDMEWYQRILKYPFRHMGTLATTSLLIGLLVTMIVPSQFGDWQSEFFFRFFMFTMTSCLMMTLAIITGIMYSKDFSENVWNSKFIK